MGLSTAVLSGCASSSDLSLATQPRLAANVAALDRARPNRPAIGADAPLTLEDVAVLTVRNSPDLRAARARRGVAQAQVLQARILPNPQFTGNYGVLLGGPGVADAIGAALSTNITALVTYGPRRRAAESAALQVNADLLWQEWQTVGRAQLLVIGLVQGAKQIALLEQTRALLAKRYADMRRAVAQGNATLQQIAPDLVALSGLEKQIDSAVQAQQTAWHDLDALLGLLPDVRPKLARAISLPRLDAVLAERLVATLPVRRPDLVALQLGYRSQQATLRAAVLGQFPALVFGGSYGSDTTRVQSAGPTLTIDLPIFDRNQGNLAIATATRQQLHDEYDARLATDVGAARALLADAALVQTQLNQAQRGLADARQITDGAGSAYESGNIDEVAYVDLVLARLNKEQEVIGLEQTLMERRASLATLLGVGLPPVSLAPATGAASKPAAP